MSGYKSRARKDPTIPADTYLPLTMPAASLTLACHLSFGNEGVGAGKWPEYQETGLPGFESQFLCVTCRSYLTSVNLALQAVVRIK